MTIDMNGSYEKNGSWGAALDPISSRSTVRAEFEANEDGYCGAGWLSGDGVPFRGQKRGRKRVFGDREAPLTYTRSAHTMFLF